MQSSGHLLFARKIPLFSSLAENSTFTPAEEVSIGLYRFNWAEVKAGHFLSDVAFIALGFLLLSLAMSYGKHFVRRDFGSLLLRAGRVWGALWCGVTAISLIIAAIDLSRLPIGRGAAAFWTAAFTVAAVFLFVLCVMTLKRATPDGPARRKSEIVIKVCGLVIAVGCASLLHVVDFPPQTALGWIVVQLLMLGVPAGVGFVLPNRENLEPERQPDHELRGARYFRTWDFVLFIPFAYMLMWGMRVVPQLSQNNIVPFIQLLLLSICLFNRVPEKETVENSRSLFGNVLSALIIVQLCQPYAQHNHSFTAYVAFIVCLVLSLRIVKKGELPVRKWWQKGRFWAIAVFSGGVVWGLAFYSIERLKREIEPIIIIVAVVLIALTIAFIFRKKDFRRPIRFVLIGFLAVVCAAVFWSIYEGGGPFPSWRVSSILSMKLGAIVTLALLLVVLVFKSPATLFARALRGRPTRVVIYSLVIVIVFLSRSLGNYPSYPLGSMYYSSSGLTENEQHALNILPPESIPASRFLQRSTFDDILSACDSSFYAWAGIAAVPVVFPRPFVRIPRLMGKSAQLVVGAGRIIEAADPSDVRLDMLYSRRVTGMGLADHLELQLRPSHFREQAASSLHVLKQAYGWRTYYDYPRAAIETDAPCRSWNSLLEDLTGTAIFALSNPPGHEALKQLWRIDELPNVSIY